MRFGTENDILSQLRSHENQVLGQKLKIRFMSMKRNKDCTDRKKYYFY